MHSPLFKFIWKALSNCKNFKNHSKKTASRSNLQPKVVNKFTRLSKIGFYRECFTADFLQFFIKKHENLVFAWTAVYLTSDPGISVIFLKFPNLLKNPSLKLFGDS